MNRLVKILKNNYYLLTAILIFLSFPSYDIWILKGFPFFAWIALVPLFYYIRDKSLKDVYFTSFIAGLAGNFFTYEWIGNFAGTQEGGYTLIVSLLIPSITVFFALRILIAEILSREFENFRFVIYPSVWIFFDWVQSIGYIAFPWVNWGHSQYPFTPFIQLASFTGIMGINFILILFNYLLSDVLYNKGKRGISLKQILKTVQAKRLFAIMVFIVISVIYGSIVLIMNNRAVKKDLRVSVVQSCISPWENWTLNKFKYLSELKNYTEDSLSENPDFIIWSESATLEYISYNYERGKLSSFDREVLEFARYCDRPLLTGEIGIVEELSGNFLIRYPQNSAVLINRFGDVLKSYPKINLVPFGEWFPYENLWLIGKSVKQITTKYGGSDFVPGNRPVLFELNDKKFGVLICYEGIFFRLCRKYRELGAEFLINITNDGWTDTYRGHMQHFSASVFRAVENGIWLIRAGNTGFTAIVDPYGRITKSIPILKKGYLAGNLDFSFNHKTFYSKSGDIILYISMIFSGGILIVFIIRRFKARYRTGS